MATPAKMKINKTAAKPDKQAEIKARKTKVDTIEKRKTKADNELTVVDVAKKIGMDPKVARAKLRRKGLKSNEGRWPTFIDGSKEYKEVVEMLEGTAQE
jgi:hypothetical protein